MKNNKLIAWLILFIMSEMAWTSNLEEDTKRMNSNYQPKANKVNPSKTLELSLRYDFMDKFEQLLNYVSESAKVTRKLYDLNQLKRTLSERQQSISGDSLADPSVSDEIYGTHAVVY